MTLGADPVPSPPLVYDEDEENEVLIIKRKEKKEKSLSESKTVRRHTSHAQRL